MKRAKILSASAGSGKTYRLVLKYICDILEQADRYRSILAVTFTNKATEEMKSRIIAEIHTLASQAKSRYLADIMRETGMGEEMIYSRALKAQTKILHDYSRFSVLTIDRFFQRILRAFVKELGLDLNYNIELDHSLLLERCADNIIESIAEKEDIRRWLIKYAEERLDDGDRWDMRGDLRMLGTELFKERGAERAERAINKERLSEIIALLEEESKAHIAHLQQLGKKSIDIIKGRGLSPESFKNGSRSFVKQLQRYADGEMKTPTATMLKAVDDISQWYGKGADANIIEAAYELQPILRDICEHYARSMSHINTTHLLKDNFRSYALLSDMHDQLNDICSKENIMVLGHAKDILSKFVDDSIAPFIYEKVGNRYDHYMIDEFQDTSVREWRNMLPLLREALASNDKASVFIVGDVKQSIYRWRGGDWRLLNSEASADLGKNNVEIEHLEKNYRSLKHVVEFNKRLISKVVDIENAYVNGKLDDALNNSRISQSTHASLYDIIPAAYIDNAKIISHTSEDAGYAEVTLYDPAITDSPFIRAIEDAISRGYRYRDILILVRGANDSRKVADALFEYKERCFTSQGKVGFNIHTSDALPLEICETTEFIIAVLRLTLDTTNDIERGVYNRFLGYRLDHRLDDDELATLRHIAHLSPVEAFEEIVSRYLLDKRNDHIAYLQAMYEQIVSYTSTHVADIDHYLAWWDERGHSENIVVEMSDDTIEITTIHKAKGLEREVVIIPYCKWDMSPRASLRPVVWASANSRDELTEIGDFPIIYGSSMEQSAFAEEYYKEFVMNHIDGLNLLYVAVTRASHELYIYTPTNLNSKSRIGDNISTTADLVRRAINTMELDAEQTIVDDRIAEERYCYGNRCESITREGTATKNEDLILDRYISHKPNIRVRYPSHRMDGEGLAPGSQSRIEGIRLHTLFEHARTREELYAALERMRRGYAVSDVEAEALRLTIEKALLKPEVAEWFDTKWSDIKSESSIICKDGIRRPDRVMIDGERVVVVDYKFGTEQSPKHIAQVKEYMSLIKSMGYATIEGYVWYIRLEEIVKI